MLNSPPPAPKVDDNVVKRSEAVFIEDVLVLKPNYGWIREVTFSYEGAEYSYALATTHARTEERARDVLYQQKPTAELYGEFLNEVHLDRSRKH